LQPFEACEAQWKEVLRSLRLGILYVPAIQAVLKEGRWKSAPNPIAYVRKSAVRAAVRLGIVDIRPNRDREILACDLQYEDEEGNELDHDEKLGMALHRYEEKFGKEYDLGAHSAEGRLPEGIFNEELDIDWERAGDLAGLDAGERLVVDLQLIGFGREAALRACLTDEDRRYLQAAWKRFDRNKDRLSQVLQSGQSGAACPFTRKERARMEPLLRQGEAEWPELELIFVETDEGELKISFQRGVPEGRG
jgi:hypothetical protein